MDLQFFKVHFSNNRYIIFVMKERKNLFEHNILVVDDEAVNRELLGAILESSF